VFKAEVPKPVKTGRQERKALRDLSQAGKPLPSAATKGKSAVTALKDKSAATALKDKSAATSLKDKSAAPSQETAKKASKNNILTDEEIAKCRDWAKEGIEHMHFSGNDMQKFEAHQQEERNPYSLQISVSSYSLLLFCLYCFLLLCLLKCTLVLFHFPLNLGVRKKVDKAMAGLRVWTDMTFGLEFPVKVNVLPVLHLTKQFLDVYLHLSAMYLNRTLSR